DLVQGHDIPYPNLNIRHRCRNYEKILDWDVTHAVHIDKPRLLASEIRLTSSNPHPSIMHRKYHAAYSLCTYIHEHLARTAIIKSSVASMYCKYINDKE
ncbi:hypothetical protein BD769DRAFT_1356222, partial [Suillus cothurnatus]